MKLGTLWLAVLAILTLLCVIGLPQRRTAKTTARAWEYRIVEIHNIAEGKKSLAELGAEGWQLAAVQTVLIPQITPANSADLRSDAVEAYYFFQRVK